MSMPVDHIEVAPRMWDKRLAANIIDSNEPVVSNQTVEPVHSIANQAFSAGASFFTRFKSIIIPVAFVLGIIIVGYIIFTYITKYRNAKDKHEVITEEEITSKKNTLNPARLIESEDLSKYEYESEDDKSESSDEESEDDQMSVIVEEDEENETDEEEEDSEEEPDLSEIEQLIQNDEYADLPILEEDEYGFDIPLNIDDKPKNKRLNKKPKPITV